MIKVDKKGVIIDKTIFIDNPEDGNNINGPCLLRIPDFVKNKLGNYYLYFAHHRGEYIRMAYSNNIYGPYTLYKNKNKNGVLSLHATPGEDHIASPDVIIKDNRFIFVYGMI